jgi:membrane protein implicated in regulation of membrane protease activity
MQPYPARLSGGYGCRVSGAEIGLQGTLTIATRGTEGAGEVELELAGGTETFLAHSTDPLPRGTSVIVIGVRGGRRVDVAPFD